ncbi:MAG: AraC family transcriptional regulator [Marinomonas sp.]
MQIDMQNVYDHTGNISEQAMPWLSGHKQHLALLPHLHLLNQHLSSKKAVSVSETAQSGLYFSFLGTGAINTIEDINEIQIAYQAKTVSGEFTLEKDQQLSLLQAHISPSLLASILGETEQHIIQHFMNMQEKLANDSGVISLPLTDKNRLMIKPVLQHRGHSISLAGHVYSLIFTLIEQLQMLSHLSHCEDCQSKLFNAQNLLETPELDTLNIEHLAHQVGLNTEALTIGFHHLTGQPIEHYFVHSRIHSAAAKLRQNPKEKNHNVAQSGFSEDQFEAAFRKHFGVGSHQYGQIH